eukprot:1365428-Pyramimonas_sp.AAC.1
MIIRNLLLESAAAPAAFRNTRGGGVFFFGGGGGGNPEAVIPGLEPLEGVGGGAGVSRLVVQLALVGVHVATCSSGD